MAARDCFHAVASGFGIAINRKKICGVLDGDGIAAQECPRDGFELDKGNFGHQLFDGDRRIVWDRSFVPKAGYESFAMRCVSRHFPMFVLCDTR
jgi:hypothetical protein